MTLPQSHSVRLTDDELLSAAINTTDELDVTRVSELVAGGWKATTIFDGDAGLLRLARAVEKAVLAKAPPSETATREIHVIFDGPPGHVAGRFVEVETPDGRSISAGEWVKKENGYWALVLKGVS